MYNETEIEQRQNGFHQEAIPWWFPCIDLSIILLSWSLTESRWQWTTPCESAIVLFCLLLLFTHLKPEIFQKWESHGRAKYGGNETTRWLYNGEGAFKRQHRSWVKHHINAKHIVVHSCPMPCSHKRMMGGEVPIPLQGPFWMVWQANTISV